MGEYKTGSTDGGVDRWIAKQRREAMRPAIMIAVALASFTLGCILTAAI